MTDAIASFLEKQSCASISCMDSAGNPYSFTCFYVFNATTGCMYFKSNAASLHSSFLEVNPRVSGTVLPDKLNKLSIIGAQLEGICLSEDHPSAMGASQYYHKKNPIALAMPGKVWVIQIDHIKLTDNSLGFGKKLHWSKDAIPAE
jgi:uncharacterized protein YhbP (UPF0306 family)